MKIYSGPSLGINVNNNSAERTLLSFLRLDKSRSGLVISWMTAPLKSLTTAVPSHSHMFIYFFNTLEVAFPYKFLNVSSLGEGAILLVI